MLNLKKNHQIYLLAAIMFAAFTVSFASVSAAEETRPNSSDSKSFFVRWFGSNQTQTSSENFEIDSSGTLCRYSGTAEKVIIPEGVKNISYGVFMDKTEIENVIFPKSLVSIDEYAFYGCRGIKEINLPESLQKLGRLAFGDCSNAKSLYLGKNFSDMGELSVWGCTNLTNISVSRDNPDFSGWNGLVLTKDKKTLLVCPSGISGELILPDSLNTISTYAFFDCDKLTGVTAGDNLKRVEEAAFFGCNNIKSINLGAGVETIGSCAFFGCSVLNEFTVGKNVSEIGSSAFYDCSAFKKLTFLSDKTIIGHKILPSRKEIIISGDLDSTAQQYALKHGYVFEPIQSV